MQWMPPWWAHGVISDSVVSALNGLLTSKFHKIRNPCLCQGELIDLRVLDKIRASKVGRSCALRMGKSHVLNQLSQFAEGAKLKTEAEVLLLCPLPHLLPRFLNLWCMAGSWSVAQEGCPWNECNVLFKNNKINACLLAGFWVFRGGGSNKH